jgi:hypothetical protein
MYTLIRRQSLAFSHRAYLPGHMSTSTVTEASSISTTVPYPPGWADRVIDWVRALPGPSWLLYLAVGVALVLAEFSAKWLDGSYPFPQINIFHAFFVAIGVYAFAGMHYLDEYAETAIATFRPALTVSDREYEELRYRLTTLPARPTAILTLLIFLLIVAVLFLSSRDTAGIYTSIKLYTSPLSFLIEGVGLLIWGAVAGPFTYHIYHQIQVIDLIYTRHTVINLFHLRPLYAFSKLTARAALILIFLIYPAFIISPNVLQDPAVWISTIGISVIALWNFLGPLLGIHRLLAEEKDRVHTEISRSIEDLSRRIDAAMASDDFGKMDSMKAALEALVLRQDRLENTPTWPWHPQTPRIIGTAFLVPIVIYLIQELIDRLLGL